MIKNFVRPYGSILFYCGTIRSSLSFGIGADYVKTLERQEFIDQPRVGTLVCAHA